jgi:hypothetical protein
MIKIKTKRIRAGLYQLTAPNGQTWTVEERQAQGGGYGHGWAWYATCDDDRELYMDPLPTLRAVKRVLELS